MVTHGFSPRALAAIPKRVVHGEIMPEIVADVRIAPGAHVQKKRLAVWVVTVTPAAGVFKPNQAIINFMNKNNNGCGLVLTRDTSLGTSALFQGSAIPAASWARLVAEITSREPDCWHVIHNPGGGIAPFIVNGNKALDPSAR